MLVNLDVADVYSILTKKTKTPRKT